MGDFEGGELDEDERAEVWKVLTNGDVWAIYWKLG